MKDKGLMRIMNVNRIIIIIVTHFRPHNNYYIIASYVHCCHIGTAKKDPCAYRCDLKANANINFISRDLSTRT